MNKDNKLYYEWVSEAIDYLNSKLYSNYTIERNMLGEGRLSTDPIIHLSNSGAISLEFPTSNVIKELPQFVNDFDSYVKAKNQKPEKKSTVKYITYMAGDNAVKLLGKCSNVENVIDKLAMLDDGNGEILSGIPFKNDDDYLYTQAKDGVTYVLTTNQDLSNIDKKTFIYLNLVKVSKDSFDETIVYKRSSILTKLAETATQDALQNPMSVTDYSDDDTIPPLEWITNSDNKDDMSEEEKDEIDEQMDGLKDDAKEKVKDELGLNIVHNKIKNFIEDENDEDEEDDEDIEDEEDEEDIEDEEDEDRNMDEEEEDQEEDNRKKHPSDSDDAYTEVY